jgi:hypothetical protein
MIRNNEHRQISWSFCRLEKRSGLTIGDELPAEIPGDVFTDLHRNGKIPDPYYGLSFHDPVSAPLWRRRLFRQWQKMIVGKL